LCPYQPILPSLFHEDTNAARLAVDLAEGWPSASIWSDEAGLVIGSHGMNDDNLMGFIGLLNRLWDGNDFDRSRLTTKSAYVRGRRLTVSLMLQPVVLKRLLSAGDGASRGMGWIARTLITWPASTIGSRPYHDASEMPALDAFHDRICELLELPLPAEGAGLILTPPSVSLSPPAFRIWRCLHDDVEAQLSRVGEFASVPDIGAKIAENAARIAGIFHAVTQGPIGSAHATTMEGAAAIAIWHLIEARRIVGATKTPHEVADASLLLEWTLSRQLEDAIEPRNILRFGPPPLRERARRDAAIKVLEEKSLARLVKLGKTDRLVLNPKARMAG
jgi:putative DNA primase/helicase